jgi:hypothetical protein
MARYLKVLTRDRRNMLILLLQPPVLALAIALLFKDGVFGSGGEPTSAAQLLFLLVMTTIWLGGVDAAREIIKERPVFNRERAAGVGVTPYLASKAAVLFGLVTLQTAALVIVTLLIRPLHESAGAYLGLYVLLLLAGFTAVGMGLLISAAVTSEDQATAFIPIAMIVQLLFGGAVVTIHEMGALTSALSSMVFSRWAYDGAGSIVHMQHRLAGDPLGGRYGDFFGIGAPLAFLMLAVFLGLLFGATFLTLRGRHR